MALSFQQVIDWLRQDAVERVVLVEAEAWDFSAGAAATFYWSDVGYISAPTDSPANTAYIDAIIGMPGFKTSMPDSFSGKASVAFGDIDLDNTNGALNWMLNCAWDGRPLRVLIGQTSWPLADFLVIWRGVTADISMPASNRVTIKARDPLFLLANKLSGAILNGVRVPQVYGEVFNVKPILVDAGNRKYQVHDGAISQIVVVRSKGAELSSSNYSVNASDGTFTVVTDYADITCDVKGSATSGSYLSIEAQIAMRILTERAGFSVADLDIGYFAGFSSYAAGIYISDEKTAAQALDDLLLGAGVCYFSTRSGKLRLTNIGYVDSEEVLTITDDDLVAGKDPVLVRRILPTALSRVGYKRNWSVSSNLSDTLTTAQASLLKAQYSIASVTHGGLKHLLAAQPDVIVSSYAAEVPALDIATQSTNASRARHVWRFSCGLIGLALQLGDTVYLATSHNAAGYGAVVGLADSVFSGEADIEVLI